MAAPMLGSTRKREPWPESPCWEWPGPRDAQGYGRFGKQGGAHRVVYQRLVGFIPEGLEIDHRCRNRGCVNPEHMDLVTHRENVLRGVGPTAKNATATHCKNGHSFNCENTKVWRGSRYCRACNREAVARYAERKAVSR